MAGESIVFQGLDDRRVELERHKENSSRLAEAEGHFRSTGIGSIEFETRVDFGVTFVTKPVASYASEIDVDALEDVLTAWVNDAGWADAYKEQLVPDNGTPMFPLVTGFVTDWDTDARGYYTGAWCGVRVYYPPLASVEGEGPLGGYVLPDVPVVVLHHFRFSAIGMKDVPTAETD